MNKLFVCFALIMIMTWGTTRGYASGQKADHHASASEKLCALTFDDGPSADPELTPFVLEKPKAHRVVATFFLIGQHVNDSTKDVVTRIGADGHEIGNHAWSYADMAGMNAEEAEKSVRDTTAVIQQYAGATPVFFRAPNLSVSSTMFSAIDLPFASGLVAGDWPGGDGETTEQIMENLRSKIRDGAIILLHDVQPKPHPTPAALDTLIPVLKEAGYEFVTLSELFKRKGVTPDAITEHMYVYVE